MRLPHVQHLLPFSLDVDVSLCVRILAVEAYFYSFFSIFVKHYVIWQSVIIYQISIRTTDYGQAISKHKCNISFWFLWFLEILISTDSWQWSWWWWLSFGTWKGENMTLHDKILAKYNIPWTSSYSSCDSEQSTLPLSDISILTSR